MAVEAFDQAIDETAQVATDVVKATAKLTEAAIRKVWSILDAASEKKPPSEYLSQDAIKAIQGVAQPGEK
jgi:hypothetical protein